MVLVTLSYGKYKYTIHIMNDDCFVCSKYYDILLLRISNNSSVTYKNTNLLAESQTSLEKIITSHQ